MTTPPTTTKNKLTLLPRMGWSALVGALGPLLALGVVVLFFGIADGLQEDGGSFLSARNMQSISVQTATVAVAALGMTIIIIAGGIDLSAGTSLALCATVLAWCLKEDVAVVIVQGDNVAGVQQKINDAQDRLERIPRELERQRRRKTPDQAAIAKLDAEHGALQNQLPKLQQKLETIQAEAPKVSRYSAPIALLAAMGTGCLTGLLNGVLISYLRVVPFIVTLGTMMLYLGLAKEVADETTVRPDIVTQIPEWLGTFLSLRKENLYYVNLYWGRVGFPLGVWLIFVLAAILAAVLRYTVFGRYVFALGSNEATARLCGINVERNKIALYALGGLFFGIAGMYQFSILSVGNPTSGTGMELKVIAAVVIGGGSLNGGRGSVVGTLTGAAVMAVITSGCTQLGLKNPVQDMILGAIIVAAVAIDQIRQRRLERS